MIFKECKVTIEEVHILSFRKTISIALNSNLLKLLLIGATVQILKPFLKKLILIREASLEL